jgi:2-polyprenyl-3-methyl-5-hydroxy-6-metoxy-1,4-benzoquinol methylase
MYPSETLNSSSYYTNQGNKSVLKFIDESHYSILDIGCGAGDTGNLIRSLYPNIRITGVTCSPTEYKMAKNVLHDCFCLDIERESLPIFPQEQFDIIMFVHVLEHLVNPVSVIQKLLPFLKKNGKIIIALPNIANWRYRMSIALGEFKYTDSGVMDKTHLHFYTFNSAVKYLIEPLPHMKTIQHLAIGGLPLGRIRNKILPQAINQTLNDLACQNQPNLFGDEIWIVATQTD